MTKLGEIYSILDLFIIQTTKERQYYSRIMG